MARPKSHIVGLQVSISEYADERLLDFHQFSPYHMRVTDGGYVIVDLWTTGRYYVVMTDYESLWDGNERERQGEKGQLPDDWWAFLDTLFFGQDMRKFQE